MLSFVLAVSVLTATPCEEVGAEAVRRLRAGEGFLTMIDVDANLKRVFAWHSDASAGYKKAFSRGFNKTFVESLQAEDKNIFEATKNGTNVTFLRCQTLPEGETALFRIDLEEKGFNYIRLLVDSKKKVSDFVSLASGKWSSENTGPLYAAAVEQEDKDYLSRLVSKKNPVLSEAKKWEVMMAHAQKQEWQEGLKVFETLSPKMRKQRVSQELHVQLAQGLGETDEYVRYRAAVDEFEKNFPNDASLNFKRIDTYFAEQNWAELEKAISALDEAVGHDAFLDIMRANVWVARGDEDKAVECALRATKGAPEVTQAHYVLIGLLAKNPKHFRRLTESLKHLKASLNMDMDVAGAALFETYRKSSEGKKYLASLKAGR